AGTVCNVPPQMNRMLVVSICRNSWCGCLRPHQEVLQIDTTNILFICGGAFVGLDDHIERRLNQKTMGFGAEIKGKKEKAKSNPLEKALPEDIIKFGMIPEFVGRLPVVATLEPLDEESLVRILKEPKNSLVRQYQTMFEFEDVKLRFTDEATRAVAREALKRSVGARGLRVILEELMLELMYNIPTQRDISECVITEETVIHRTQPLTTLRKAV
ncbi:MAG: AAA family ATPase, partial [Thermoanaerobaculia bacterium]|nr:AAA family ATPase [Thermoanaerobaculia bacterium]